jgi:hypothetical protein
VLSQPQWRQQGSDGNLSGTFQKHCGAPRGATTSLAARQVGRVAIADRSTCRKRDLQEASPASATINSWRQTIPLLLEQNKNIVRASFEWGQL